MKKQLTEKVVYEPRPGVKITVTNKPEYDEQTNNVEYKRTVALTVDAGRSTEKFTFADSDQMADYFGNVDFEEPQLSLPLNQDRGE